MRDKDNSFFVCDVQVDINLLIQAVTHGAQKKCRSHCQFFPFLTPVCTAVHIVVLLHLLVPQFIQNQSENI